MAVYKYNYVEDVSNIWDYLGTFWNDFEDKETIELLWNGALQSIRHLQRDLYILGLSKTLSTCPAIINSEFDYYTLIYSGETATLNLDDGYYYLNLPAYTITVTGVYLISNSGAYTYESGNVFYSYTSGLVPNVDYSFGEATDYRLKLLTTFPETSEIMISGSQKINPVLYKSYGILVDYDIDTWKAKQYIPYFTQVGDTLTGMITIDEESDYWLAMYSKYVIWALTYYKRSVPTISGIKDSLSVAAGLPFSIYSGIVMYTGISDIIIDHGTQFTYRYITYTLPVGTPGFRSDIISGEYISQFYPLTTGINVYDNFTLGNPTYVSSLLPSGFQQNSKLVIEFDEGILV
jgi:hypothetical protein